MNQRWCWVSLHYATFGLLVERVQLGKFVGFKVVDAPPIARWAVGRDWDSVRAFYRRKGAEFQWLTAGT